MSIVVIGGLELTLTTEIPVYLQNFLYDLSDHRFLNSNKKKNKKMTLFFLRKGIFFQ